MADSSTDSIGSCDAERLDQTTRDIFQGKALIDRLLVYFSKFEGSREKARKYGQKLLDLGHVESLTQSYTFEDSFSEYRWTDVASVMNKAKAKAQENTGKSAHFEPVISESPKQSLATVRPNNGRPTVRISIEADNCDGAEIQAHIRTVPPAATAANSSHSSTKSGDTFCLAEVQKGKMISFTTETSKTEEILRMVPVSAMSQRKEIPRDELINEARLAELRIIAPENKKEVSVLDPISEKRERFQNTSDVDSAVEVDKSTTADETSPIVKSRTPGKGERAQERLEFSGNGEHTNRNTGKKPSLHKYKWDTSDEVLYNKRNHESLHKRTYNSNNESLSRPSVRTAESDSKPGTAESSLSGTSRSDISTPEHPRKLKFKEDSDWIKMRREYLEHEEIRQATERGYDQHVELFDNSEISLHSTAPHDTIVEEPESGDEHEVQQTKTVKHEEHVKTNFLAPPTHGMMPSPSPPPSSPTSPRKSSDQGLKSLFWTKISCEAATPDEMESIFWLNVEKKVTFDHEEFTRLFSKPAPSSIQKSSRRIIQEDTPGSKTLKVLGTERSRQVGIRASSIHIPAEDIHDAIINMDDSVLHLDALEALYDVRPSPDELDDIADALKRNPNGILDKPEQFVLMLAMLSNLDERLKVWIFVKRFPDKILDIKEQLNTISSVCIQIVRNATLQRLLEATLVFGNFMNQGTQRGSADGYVLDILPKLKDVKSQGGDTNLMLYLVKWVIAECEKANKTPDIMHRQASKASTMTQDGHEDDCGLPNQANMQKACAASLQDVLEDIETLMADLHECRQQLIPAVIEGATCLPEIKAFNERMKDFVEQAEKAMTELQSLSKEASEIAEEFKKYYIPGDTKSESFTSMLKHLSAFCEDFRYYWDEEKRNVAKEAFFNTEKARRQRMAAVKVAKSPSALKARFLEKRRRERVSHGGESESYSTASNKPDVGPRHVPHAGASGFNRSQRHVHYRSKTENDTQDNEATPTSSRRVESRTINEATRRHPTPVRPQVVTRPRQNPGGNHPYANGRGIPNGHVPIEKSSSTRERNSHGQDPTNSPAGMSKMKQAMQKRRMLLKSKTC